MRTSFSPGGVIPDELVAGPYNGISKMLLGMSDNANNNVRYHYTSEHTPVYGGNGKIIKPYHDGDAHP